MPKWILAPGSGKGPDRVLVIATFDNDGTLWAERPIYFQFAFAIDRVKAQAREHPEWRDAQPFKAVIEGDPKALAAAGEKRSGGHAPCRWF